MVAALAMLTVHWLMRASLARGEIIVRTTVLRSTCAQVSEALQPRGEPEILGGFSLGAGLLTPVGTILVGAVMTTAILTAHARNGISAAEGGFEFPLVLLALAFVISANGAGSYSFNHWLDVSN
jgi:hypothetical protein